MIDASATAIKRLGQFGRAFRTPEMTPMVSAATATAETLSDVLPHVRRVLGAAVHHDDHHPCTADRHPGHLDGHPPVGILVVAHVSVPVP